MTSLRLALWTVATTSLIFALGCSRASYITPGGDAAQSSDAQNAEDALGNRAGPPPTGQAGSGYEGNTDTADATDLGEEDGTDDAGGRDTGDGDSSDDTDADGGDADGDDTADGDADGDADSDDTDGSDDDMHFTDCSEWSYGVLAMGENTSVQLTAIVFDTIPADCQNGDIVSTANWGEFVQINSAGATDATLSIYPMYGEDKDTAVYFVRLDETATNASIPTDQLAPGTYDVVKKIPSIDGDFYYHTQLIIRPIIEISLKREGIVGPTIGKPFTTNVYLPNGTDISEIRLESELRYTWADKPSGNHAATFTPNVSGDVTVTGTVKVNGVDGMPATLVVRVQEDCGTDYQCLVETIRQKCTDEERMVHTTTLQIPKFQGCTYGQGDNLDGTGNQLYRFLVAEESTSVTTTIPENAILCGIKRFEATHNVIQRDQMAVLMNNTLMASSVQAFTSLLPQVNGFHQYDWLTLRGGAGFSIENGTANPPDYCLGMENADGSCDVPERSQPHDVPGLLSLRPGDQTVQAMFAHFEISGVEHNAYTVDVHAYGDTDAQDCRFDDVSSSDNVEMTLEWYYVTK